MREHKARSPCVGGLGQGKDREMKLIDSPRCHGALRSSNKTPHVCRSTASGDSDTGDSMRAFCPSLSGGALPCSTTFPLGTVTFQFHREPTRAVAELRVTFDLCTVVTRTRMPPGHVQETPRAERGDIGASSAGEYSGPIQVCL